MKSKKFLAGLAVLALGTSTLTLAGCDKDKVEEVVEQNTTQTLTNSEFIEYGKDVAKGFFANHVDYENFADSTFKGTSYVEYNDNVVLEYKEAATDTSTKKGTFVDVRKVEQEANVYVKGVGEDKAIKVTMTATNTRTENELDANDLVVTTTTVTTQSAIYTLAPITDGNDTNYVFVAETSIKVGTADPTTSKKYITIEDKEDYVEAVEEVLRQAKELTNQSFIEYFDTDTLYMMSFYNAKIEKDGNNVNVTAGLNAFQVNNSYEYSENSVSFEIKYNNKFPSEYKQEYTNTGSNYSSVMRQVATVTNSVSFNIDNTLLTGATEDATLANILDNVPDIFNIDRN